MSSQDIYLSINNEIFTDPFYNFCKTDSRRLVAWYFLNVLSFTESETRGGIIESEKQRFIDLVLFDDENGTAYVAASDFRGVHDKLDVLSFNKPFNFLKYMASPMEYELTGDVELDRRVYYLNDCIKREYKVIFLFITTASFDDDCAKAISKAKESAASSFSFNLIVDAIDGDGLSERYYEADSIERAKQSDFEEPGKAPESITLYAGDLPMEDRRAGALLIERLKAHWKVREDEISVGLPGLEAERGVPLHLFAILQGFCVCNGIKRNLLPPLSLAFFNMERNYLAGRIMEISSKWLFEAFKSGRTRIAGVGAAAWEKDELCLSDVRNAVEKFFLNYSSVLAKSVKGGEYDMTKAFSMPESCFILPLNRFFLMGEETAKAVAKSPREFFFGCIAEKDVRQEDREAVDVVLERTARICAEFAVFSTKDAVFRNALIATGALGLMGCFALFSKERQGRFPLFSDALGRLESKFLFEEALRTVVKCIVKAYGDHRSESGDVSLRADVWMGGKECYFDVMKEVSRHFSLLSMMNGDSLRIYGKYEEAFSLKSKNFKYNLDLNGFKKVLGGC